MTGSPKAFEEQKKDLMARGYTHVRSKLYPQMRHEILNEINRTQVYEDFYHFLNRILEEKKKAAGEDRRMAKCRPARSNSCAGVCAAL